MKVDFATVRSFTSGYLSYAEDERGLRFFRMSEKSTEGWKSISDDFFRKCSATIGVNYDFYTDASALEFTYGDITYGSSRKFFYFDVYINGALCGRFGSEADEERQETYSFSLALPDGLNRVTVYSPWSVGYTLRSIDLTDCTKIVPVVKSCRMLILGDSITHGYDAKYPSLCYSNRLAAQFNAETINQAIGGAKAMKTELDGGAEPDIITVAFGTNDWSGKTYEDFSRDYTEFAATLRALYPDAEIYLLSPVYRCGSHVSACGKFPDVPREIISRAAEKHNCFFVDCYDFVPHIPEAFSPDGLHPNDFGFDFYAKGVAAALLSLSKVLLRRE